MIALPAKVIVNPAAGGCAVKRDWPSIRRRLRHIGLPFDAVLTDGPGQALELTKQAIDDGYRYIIAVGGDGTVNEIVNAILTSSASDSTLLGVLNAGTACSFARSLGIPSNYLKACSVLEKQRTMKIDVGIVNYTKNDKQVRRFFINEADVGFGAAVVEGTRQIPVSLGRSINYAPFVISAIRTLLRYENRPIAVHIDGKQDKNRVCSMVVVANGSYYGGTMQMAPKAKLDDGLLDAVIIGDIDKTELANIWLMSYAGNHVNHPKISVVKAKTITVSSSEHLLIEVDGELIGEGPASFSLLPQALNVVV